MKAPKSLIELAATVDGSIHSINYRAHGQVSKGWVIVDKDRNELLEVEPVYYSNGDRWIVRNKTFNRHFYVKSLRYLHTKCQIQAGYTGYKLSL